MNIWPFKKKPLQVEYFIAKPGDTVVMRPKFALTPETKPAYLQYLKDAKKACPGVNFVVFHQEYELMVIGEPE